MGDDRVICEICGNTTTRPRRFYVTARHLKAAKRHKLAAVCCGICCEKIEFLDSLRRLFALIVLAPLFWIGTMTLVGDQFNPTWLLNGSALIISLASVSLTGTLIIRNLMLNGTAALAEPRKG